MEVEWVVVLQTPIDAIVRFDQDLRMRLLDRLDHLQNALGVSLTGQRNRVTVRWIVTERSRFVIALEQSVLQKVEHHERRAGLRERS